MKKQAKALVLTLFALTLLGASSANAQSTTSTAEAIKALQAQVNALQKQLADMQAKEETRAAAEKARQIAPQPVVAPALQAQAAPASAPAVPAAGAVASSASAPAATQASAPAKAEGKEILPGVSVKLGGYIAAEGLYRTKEMNADASSSVSAIPYANSLSSKADELRASARATRLSMLAEGSPDADTKLAAFVEVDFMGAGFTSNNVQSNSYDLRLRHAYAQVDREDLGLHFLAGQAFSLTTLYKQGLSPRKEVGVNTIDSFGSPGYVYTRSPGVRIVKDFADKKGFLGLSLEEPEVNFGGITPPSDVSATVAGRNANYSRDYAPDVVVKAAYDSSFGHYELFSLTRFFRSMMKNTGDEKYAVGYGLGAGAYIPLLDKKVELAANVLAGRGLGRYSAAQMPDIAFSPTGKIRPVGMWSALVGVNYHPTSNWDLYTYLGAERAMRDAQGGGGDTYGYGNRTLNNAGCYTLGGTCNAQTEFVWQITPGVWRQVYKGNYGQMKVGAQYAYMRKKAFSGANDLAPEADDNIIMLSFRYYPF